MGIRCAFVNCSIRFRLIMQGLFSRMSFRRELFLGGLPNITLATNRTGARQLEQMERQLEAHSVDRTGATGGFVGCVRRLKINSKLYDIRKGAFVGDSLYGVDVGLLRL